MVSSSSAENWRCSTRGLSWLHHLRRHDFPDLPLMWRLIKDQLLAPCFSTRRVRTRSSSALHGPLICSDLGHVLGVVLPTLLPAEMEASEVEESDEEVEHECRRIAAASMADFERRKNK
uniref:Uncharacterized protein n=1 Tax=Kalanchoe fedtschenkoi TaxID=63787 RepID=A0A7N0V127_KALFE